jgi:DNA-binding NarL/FixJ family response regulator
VIGVGIPSMQEHEANRRNAGDRIRRPGNHYPSDGIDRMKPRAKRLSILVADDHELVRRGVHAVLGVRRGWKIVGKAVNGKQAVEKARKLKPDVLIVDISMPDLDGLEATRQILQVSPQTKVLTLTMHESDQMVRRVLEAGARGYVLKSDLAKQLVRAVSSVSQGNIFLTPKVSNLVLEGFRKAGKNPEEIRSSRSRPTSREREIILLLAEGKANKQIAEKLGITVRTVEAHRANIMTKLGLHSVIELVHYAIHNNIISAREF